MKKTIIVFIAIISCLLYGCGGEPECPLNYTSLARFEFVDSQTHAAVKLNNRPTVTGTIWMDGTAETDTVFNQAESYMSVPLSYTDRTTYFKDYPQKININDDFNTNYDMLSFIFQCEDINVIKPI